MNARFDIQPTPITGLNLLLLKRTGDSRGYLERLYCRDELEKVAHGRSILQINHTVTAIRGTVRGLHFQRPPYAETKFVTCLRGEVFDVAVDIRRGSPTFLRWYAERLSPGAQKMLVIPEGFAHGFQTLTDDCEMLYFHTAAYSPEAEDGLNVRDPGLGINWPLTIAEISARDIGHRLIETGFEGVVP